MCELILTINKGVNYSFKKRYEWCVCMCVCE